MNLGSGRVLLESPAMKTGSGLAAAALPTAPRGSKTHRPPGLRCLGSKMGTNSRGSVKDRNPQCIKG